MASHYRSGRPTSLLKNVDEPSGEFLTGGLRKSDPEHLHRARAVNRAHIRHEGRSLVKHNS
jgi:hypothetical protein